MLIRFVVNNFLSFKEETEFNMLPGNFKIHKNHILQGPNNINVLKAAAVYGANASGKTNLITALNNLRDMVHDGLEEGDVLNDTYFRLSEEHSNLPTGFEVEFHSNGVTYSYGFDFDADRIHSEWLYEISPKKDDVLLFERETSTDGVTKIELKDSLIQSEKENVRMDIYQEEIFPNQLFLHEVHKRKLGFFDEVLDWMFNQVQIIFPGSTYAPLVHKLAEDVDFLKKANKILRLADTGVDSLKPVTVNFEGLFLEHSEKKDILKTLRKSKKSVVIIQGNNDIDYAITLSQKNKPVVKKIMCVHKSDNGEDVLFDIPDESDGTCRLINLIPAFVDCMLNDKIYVVDELDRSMHPHLSRALVEMFLVDNPESKGQLIFTTHESNLLDLKLFRQDEIWFTEKKKSQSSSMYSLSAFKPRYDKDIRKGYLMGRFGAIPFTSDPKALSWT